MQDRKRDTDVKNKLLDSDGEGEGRVIWENSTETCILSYVKEMTSPSSIHETGHSKLLHWDNSEGWDGEGSVRGVWDRGTHIYPWLIHVNVWQNPPQYCKVISLQLKLIKKIITCWDFYWNCVESINQERRNGFLTVPSLPICDHGINISPLFHSCSFRFLQFFFTDLIHTLLNLNPSISFSPY